MLTRKLSASLALFLTILYFTRIVVPHAMYYYLPILIVSFLIILFSRRNYLFSDLKEYFLRFPLVLILLAIFSFHFFISGIYDRALISEFISGCALLVFLFILNISITSIEELGEYVNKLSLYLIFFSFITSIVGFLKLYLELRGISIPLISDSDKLSTPALMADYNFYALLSLICIVLISPFLMKVNSPRRSMMFQIILLISSINVILTTSRRGFVILFFMISVLLFIYFFSAFFKHHLLRLIIKNTKFFVGLLIPILSISFIITECVPPSQKIKLGNSLGLSEIFYMKYTSHVYNQIHTIFSRKANLGITYDRLWKMNFDPRLPYSGWGNRVYTADYELDGYGSENIPKGSIGYRLDRSTNGSVDDGTIYSNTTIAEVSLKSEVRFFASVYCYVSPDYDGTSPKLNSNGDVKGKLEAVYDLSRKGEWQKLNILFYGDTGNAQIYLSFSKVDCQDFSSLTGHVSFAYPEYGEVTHNPLDPKTWAMRNYKEVLPLVGKNSSIVPEGSRGYLIDRTSDFGTWDGNIYLYSNIGDSIVASGDEIVAEVYCFVSTDFNGDWVKLRSEGNTLGTIEDYYNLDHKGEWQLLKLHVKCDDGKAPVYMYISRYGTTDTSDINGYVIFAYPTYMKIIFKSDTKTSFIKSGLLKNEMASLSYASAIDMNVLDHILCLRFIKKIYWFDLFFQDTEVPNNLTSSMIDPRLSRWRFGLRIFWNQYSTLQKFTGGGFNYMKLYNNKFIIGSEKLDYPHNPFISVLLYSGILGLLIYILFIMRVIYLYWWYWNTYWQLFICFLITFFFSFFSGNSPYDPPIMGFFVILPFFIHFVHVKNSKMEA